MSRAGLVAALIRLVTGARALWIGCVPEQRQRIYFANHSSNLDALVIWASLPPAIRAVTRPVGADDYWSATAIRRWLARDVFNAILIERVKVTARNNPLVPMRAALDEGSSLIIFPEGTRNQDEELLPFKAGLWHLAKGRELELVPVYLENLNRILPKGEVLPVPLLGAASFGEPLRFDPDEPRDAFLERARAAVGGLRR